MEPVVEISHLHHAYGKGHLSKPVLIDINLTIEPGEIVILTGPSGSGKTTLLSLMGGLRSLQQGSLRVFGQELMGATRSQMVELRSNIGYIFQAHNLLDCLTAQENVRMSLRLQKQMTYNERTEKASAMLTVLGLGHRLNYLPSGLSGGQKQRVAIARALVTQPKLVLADEPTAALDSQSGREVVELMQRLSYKEGCTILLVTHDNRILDIAHRILHMEDGQLVKSEKPQSATA